MKYSISEAARIVGVTRKTLYKHIDKKPLTVEKDSNDNPVIDASELMRVYGDACIFDESKRNKDAGEDKQEETATAPPKTESLAVVNKELELLKQQMTSEKNNYEEQIEYLRSKLDEANSETRKLTALLTDQTTKSDRAGAWEQSLQSLEERIANQETAKQEEKDRLRKVLRQNQALKNALREEKATPFWKKLFG